MIREAGGRPSFKNYKTPDDKVPYPASLCVSINEEVVHGLPSERILKEGDVVSLDLGMEYKGFYTDMAVTAPVGQASEQAKKLIATAQEALNKGISAVKAGRLSGISGRPSNFAPKETDLMSCGNWSGTDLAERPTRARKFPILA